jgi:hypothetical protein
MKSDIQILTTLSNLNEKEAEGAINSAISAFTTPLGNKDHSDQKSSDSSLPPDPNN